MAADGDSTSGVRAGHQLHVLFVCSANLCRSVTAAEYARRAVDELPATRTGWQIASAGTDVHPDNRLPPEIASTMEELGISSRRSPQALSEPIVRDADLILTAERHHRATVARRFPYAVRYTYTLLDFERLLRAGRAAAPAADELDLHDLVRIGRSHVLPVDDPTIDIGDPVARPSPEAMRECAASIWDAVSSIVA